MTYTYERSINYYETDAMGIVHHSNYIRYFEEARIGFLDALEMPLAEMESNGIVIPVLSVEAKYKKMVRFGDTILINVKPERYTGIKLALSYEVTNKETKELVTTGSSSHGFLDRSDKPITLKRSFPEYHERLMNAME